MPQNHKTSSQEPLTLLYRNGEAATSGQVQLPRFSDICLTKDSQNVCESVIDEAKNFEHPIRSDKECQDYIALHGIVDEIIKKLKDLAKADREALTKILSQISAALEPVQTKLVNISHQLRERISQWRALVEEGKRREEERLRAEAEEKRNVAKYTDDPKKRRQATVQAKQLETAAREVAPKPEKGVDTEEYWEGEITNRVQAAKLPDKIVLMDVDQTELNRHVKSLQRAGQKITPNILPGLTIQRKTRVRFHR